jgi:hypothetical protein
MNYETLPKKRVSIKNLFILFFIFVFVVFWAVMLSGYFHKDNIVYHAAAVEYSLPVEVKNSLETVFASTWEAVPVYAPYDGLLTIDASVVSGNNLNVMLLRGDQIEGLKNDTPYQRTPGFDAFGAREFSRSQNVGCGLYYLVFTDKSDPAHSSKSSEVKVLATMKK